MRFQGCFFIIQPSPAHLAASKGLTEALEVLVQYKGSLELRNNAGDLPIHEAAIFQQEGQFSHILKVRYRAIDDKDRVIDKTESVLRQGKFRHNLNVSKVVSGEGGACA